MAGGKGFGEVQVGGVGVPVVLAGVFPEAAAEVDKCGMISRAILVYERLEGVDH